LEEEDVLTGISNFLKTNRISPKGLPQLSGHIERYNAKNNGGGGNSAFNQNLYVNFAPWSPTSKGIEKITGLPQTADEYSQAAINLQDIPAVGLSGYDLAQKALEMDPHSAMANFAMGRAQWLLHRENAADFFKRAIELGLPPEQEMEAQGKLIPHYVAQESFVEVKAAVNRLQALGLKPQTRMWNVAITWGGLFSGLADTYEKVQNEINKYEARSIDYNSRLKAAKNIEEVVSLIVEFGNDWNLKRTNTKAFNTLTEMALAQVESIESTLYADIDKSIVQLMNEVQSGERRAMVSYNTVEFWAKSIASGRQKQLIRDFDKLWGFYGLGLSKAKYYDKNVISPLKWDTLESLKSTIFENAKKRVALAYLEYDLGILTGSIAYLKARSS